MKFVEAEGKWKVKGRRKYFVDKKKNTFLDALGLELFPWPLLEFIFIVKEVLGAVFGIFWASLGLAQSKFLRRPLVPRFYKVSTMALPGDTSSSSVSVLGTTIGNLAPAPRFVGSCRCL